MNRNLVTCIYYTRLNLVPRVFAESSVTSAHKKAWVLACDKAIMKLRGNTGCTRMRNEKNGRGQGGDNS